MKNKTQFTKWTSHTEINAEPCRARIHRLQRHNKILTLAIAAMVGIIVPLFFATLVIACG
jgi:hypothetical protein